MTVQRVSFAGENFREFCVSVVIRESFIREILFSRYRASGRGALGYHKFAKVFSAKIYFQAIHESFLPRKKPPVR